MVELLFVLHMKKEMSLSLQISFVYLYNLMVELLCLFNDK